MDARRVAEIVAKIMYLDNPEDLNHEKSLFKKYGMSSIDFLDFAFELREQSGKDFEPQDLWPVNAMLGDPMLYAGTTWTLLGQQRLQNVLQLQSLPRDVQLTELYEYFSIQFVARRLASFPGS
jgi:acyl carrier protein